jgi:hypothetical protein
MVISRKKRKYTRKKKNNLWLYFKKIIKLIILCFIVHIIFINSEVLFSNIQKVDVILITWDSQQNSKNISSDLNKQIDSSMELFKRSKAKKILILWENNIFKIDEIKIIKEFLSKNDLWEGNIAYENSSIANYPKNTKIFLDANDWESMIYSSTFWEYYKQTYNFSQRISINNIEISYYYSWFFNSLIGIFTNYYYWWKI